MSTDTGLPNGQSTPALASTGSTPPKRSHGCWIVGLVAGLAAVLLCALAAVMVGPVLSLMTNPTADSGRQGYRDTSPAWSPDGRSIAFVSNRDGHSHIYVMRPDGTDIVQLTHDPGSKPALVTAPPDDVTPSWSPDGTRIAFASSRDSGMMSFADYDLYTIKRDGSDFVRITPRDAVPPRLYCCNAGPAWSPDGTHIAFQAQSSDEGIPWHIYVMLADQSGLIQLTMSPGNHVRAVWSPDGTRIAYALNAAGKTNIYTAKADGSEETRLTDPTAGGDYPAWSPDGNRLVYVSSRDGNTHLFVMKADGSEVTQLTSVPALHTEPRWSPDGTRIVYTSDRDGAWHIYLMNADGSGVTQLTR